jgi:hypothetical protein
MNLANRLIAAGTVLLATGFACAATWYVDDDAPSDPCAGDPNISDPLEDGSLAHPFDAIQKGINAASNGDEVVVLPGRYTGPGNREIGFAGPGGALTVRSVDPNDPNVVAATVVDCQGDANNAGWGVGVGVDANSVLAGLTITNGYGYGGGIMCFGCSVSR